jgi:hypothetical protein
MDVAMRVSHALLPVESCNDILHRQEMRSSTVHQAEARSNCGAAHHACSAHAAVSEWWLLGTCTLPMHHACCARKLVRVVALGSMHLVHVRFRYASSSQS